LARRLTFILALALILAPLEGCLFHTRRVESRLSAATLKTATLPELVGLINLQAAQIQTMNATVDIAASVGGARKGKETDYTSIRGYVLVRKPAMLRLIGLVPVVRNRAFDMVSNGQDFRLSIPPKNKFIVGPDELGHPSKNALENLRPRVILDALLLRPIDPQKDVAVLEQTTEQVRDPKSHKEVEQPNYTVNVISRDENGNSFLSRKIIFDRVDLHPGKQIIYDRLGSIQTIATYTDFDLFQGVSYPKDTVILRPQEEYRIELTIIKLTLNAPLKDEQFVLNQPPGSQLQRVGEEPPQQSQAEKGAGPGQ
jgi:hypothetical protein